MKRETIEKANANANALIKQIEKTNKKIEDCKAYLKEVYAIRFYTKSYSVYAPVIEINIANPEFPTIADFFTFWSSTLETRKADLEKELEELEELRE